MQRHTRTLPLLCILTLITTASATAGPVKITPDGIQFSDETKQTTAAAGAGCQRWGVYDGNDVFIGYYLGRGGSGVSAYDPDLPFSYTVVVSYDPKIDIPEYDVRYYTSDDCTGEMCLTFFTYGVFKLTYLTDTYYIIDTSKPLIYKDDVKTYNGTDGLCRKWDGYAFKWFYPIKKVKFPLADIDLDYPITIRPVK